MAGYCAGFIMPGFMNRMGPAGFGRRGGRGWRHQYHATGPLGWARAGMAWSGYPYPAPATPAEAAQAEVEAIRAQVQHHEQALEALRRRLQTLEGAQGPAA
jgi:hypothetical protein